MRKYFKSLFAFAFTVTFCIQPYIGLKAENQYKAPLIDREVAIEVSLADYQFDTMNMSSIIRRAIIDIGSAGMKLTVAELDIEKKAVLQVLLEKKLDVPYAEYLERNQQLLNEQIQQIGLKSIKLLMDEAYKLGATEIIGVTTAALRSAKNGDQHLEDILKQTNLMVYKISQRTEGELGNLAAKINKPIDMAHIPEFLVWDIGGGSLQLSYETFSNQNKRSIFIHGGTIASGTFMHEVIRNVKKADVGSPNPMSHAEILASIQLARQIALADNTIKSGDKQALEMVKLQISKGIPVIGIGNVHNRAILADVIHNLFPNSPKNYYTIDQVARALKILENKSDQEIALVLKLQNPDLAVNQVTNLALIYGIMQELGLKKVHTVMTNIGIAGFFLEELWPHKTTPKQANEAQIASL